jgi:hypothetical protein
MSKERAFKVELQNMTLCNEAAKRATFGRVSIIRDIAGRVPVELQELLVKLDQMTASEK